MWNLCDRSVFVVVAVVVYYFQIDQAKYFHQLLSRKLVTNLTYWPALASHRKGHGKGNYELATVTSCLSILFHQMCYWRRSHI